jgi:chromosome segregation ATPase
MRTVVFGLALVLAASSPARGDDPKPPPKPLPLTPQERQELWEEIEKLEKQVERMPSRLAPGHRMEQHVRELRWRLECLRKMYDPSYKRKRTKTQKVHDSEPPPKSAPLTPEQRRQFRQRIEKLEKRLKEERLAIRRMEEELDWLKRSYNADRTLPLRARSDAEKVQEEINRQEQVLRKLRRQLEEMRDKPRRARDGK